MATRELAAAVGAVLPECVGLRLAILALDHVNLPPLVAVLGGRKSLATFLHKQLTTGLARAGLTLGYNMPRMGWGSSRGRS